VSGTGGKCSAAVSGGAFVMATIGAILSNSG
jgi:hypothetical protein